MKRLVVITSLFAATGCSVLWSMDSYDESGASTARTTTSDGGRTDRLVDGAGGTTSGEEDARGSVADTGSANDSGTTSDAPIAECDGFEAESNDTAASANDLLPGKTCGGLSSSTDNDYFTFVVDHSVDFSLQLTSSLRARLRETTNGNVDNNYTGGANPTTIPAGTYELRIWFYAGSAPLAYKVTRGG